jgi:ElaB/YqjD/DUF883 family membrane-anchored ribosome-binding protein
VFNNVGFFIANFRHACSRVRRSGTPQDMRLHEERVLMKSPPPPQAAESAADVAGETVKGYVDRGVEACNAVTEKSRAVGRQVDEYARTNAWALIGAGVGVGLLIGMLLRRRR